MKVETAKKRFPFLMETEGFQRIIKGNLTEEITFHYSIPRDFKAFFRIWTDDNEIQWSFSRWSRNNCKFIDIEEIDFTPEWFQDICNKTRNVQQEAEKLREVLK